MLDKELIKKNFKKSLLTYNQNAIVQNKMAQKLVELLPNHSFEDILEIGSYTGVLTNIICEKIKFDSYLALDIIDSCDFIKKINSKIDFIKTDIENFETTKKFDLIIANASLQWCNNFGDTIKKLKTFLKKGGILAFSIFSDKNLIEIKDIFEVGLKYPEIDNLKMLLRDSKIVKNKETLKFKSSLELLKHLKFTGVNSINSKKLSYVEIKNKLKLLDEKYQNTLTYEPLYVIYQN